ncbi:MAG: YjjG family noncanonical pyrimidine nucleotidase [Pseudoflavonifractor sp.]
MARYDYVLFDADNTLLDFDAAEARALDQTLAQYGYPVTDAAREVYLAANRALWGQFDRREVTQAQLVVERFAALQRTLGGEHDPAEMNRFYLARLAEGGDLLPGAGALCAKLAPHCTLAIVTNGVASAQRGRFARSGLAPLIPHLFISEELGCQKPQKEFFCAVLSALSMPPPERVLVVGDSLAADIQGAINAGLDSCWYNPGRLPRNPQVLPTYEVCDFNQLADLLVSPSI